MTKGSKARKEIISMPVVFNVGIDIKLIIIANYDPFNLIEY